MPKKSSYPDWVLKHKKTGTYVNKVGDKYYLYAAHSERVEGKKYPVRVSDGYIGRITERDGLIPAQSKIRTAPVSFEVGLSYVIISRTEGIIDGLKKTYRKYGTAIYCCAILSYIFGSYGREFFDHSYVGIRFKGTEFPDKFTDAQTGGIERGVRMISDVIAKEFGDDIADIRRLFTEVRLIRVNDTYYLSGLLSEAMEISKKYSIEWGNGLWQK